MAMGKAIVRIGDRVFQVDVAKTAALRARGLSSRDGLGENEGLFFIFDKPGNYGFWMIDMKFPIDIIWINGGRVVGFAENAAPEPGKRFWGLKIYYPPEPVQNVLELGAGAVAKFRIKIGDLVSLSGLGEN